jgi:DNA polymerase III delta prime subunit
MAGDKYYKAERARQAQFKKSEEAMNKKYKQVTDDETVFEYLNKLRPEDSTREYNEVEHYKGGGIAKGCGKVMKDRKKVTKMY